MNAVRLLGSLMGGRRRGGGGGLMGSLLGGGAGSMLGGLLGGSGGRMAGGLLGSLVGGKAGRGGAKGVLGSLLGGGDDKAEAIDASPEAEEEAILLIRAMCNAAKSDGEVSEDEVQKIMGELGDIDDDEREFLKAELTSPLDLAGFARSVPDDLAPDVYAASLLAIELDTGAEHQYLGSLAAGLGLDNSTVADIHEQLGAPAPA